MAQLPPDILRAISIIVREEEGLGTLTKISQVCRLWWEVVEPVLLAHVVLDNVTLSKFIEHHTNASDQLKIVRSVTLHIQVIASLHPSEYNADTLESYKLHGSPKSRTLNQNIGRFSNSILPKLSSLESFSFFVDAPALDEARQRINPYDIGFWLDISVLGHLLRSLPASCSSLELETSGTDWSPRPESHHLCPDIWSILPRFRHMKLRIHTLCSRILLRNPEDPGNRRNEPDLRELRPTDTGNLVQADHLSTLSICMVPRASAGYGYITCPERQVMLDRGMDPYHISGGGGYKTRPPLLVSNLVSGHRMGCFPAALKLEVVQNYHFLEDYPSDEDDLGEWAVMTQQEIQRRKLYERAILIRDCIEDKTYPLPRRYIAEAMHGMYDKSDTCWVGARDDVERHAENTVWDETIYGARMPFGANGALSGATPKPPPKLLTRKEWRQRSNKGMLSWRREEGRTGVKIRRVIPLDGVDVDFDLTLMPLLPARGEPIPGDDRGVL
jgi:hypothetical protein